MKITKENFENICKDSKFEATNEESYWLLIFRKVCNFAGVESNLLPVLGNPPKTYIYQHNLLQTIDHLKAENFDSLNIASKIFQNSNI